MNDTAPRSSGITERVVLLFLVASCLVLGWIYFAVMPGDRAPDLPPFDFRNPMLDAREGQCVQVESVTRPGNVACMKVREPGLVLRPRNGPDRLGIYNGLRRSRPYLATGLRYPPPGASCADAASLREDIELFDLNAFGMPYSLDVALDQIRPLWVKQGTRFLYVYEVQMTQYGRAARTWQLAIQPDGPITGIVRRSHTAESGTETAIFLPAEDCP